MIYLTTDEVIQLQSRVIAQSGGLSGVKDRGLVDSAVAQPRQSFGGEDLYPTLAEKAAAMGFSLASNHGFEDGNKRIAHAALEAFLVINGHELSAPVDEQEKLFWQLASKQVSRETFTEWVVAHTVILGT